MEKEFIKYNTDITNGLTDEQINDRINNNLLNYDTSIPTKRISKIISDNIFTPFNLLNFILALAIFLVGSYKNLLFFGVVICNTLISTIQEIRSKKIIDRLSVISQTKVIVQRNGKEEKINVNEIVLDDIVILKSGYQVVVDSILKSGNVEVNEAFITGESEPVYKKKGDIILSGSFIVSGTCKAQVIHIGEENYTSIISRDAKVLKKIQSEIMRTLNKIIRFISIIIIPISILLFMNQINIDGNNFESAVINTVAAIIGMIPEGLVLLTSTVLAVSIIRISKYNVLVQELYSIEALARVNTICLDKTGTITEGVMEVSQVVSISKQKNREIELMLSFFANTMCDINSTMDAIVKKYSTQEKIIPNRIINFSSSRKYCGIEINKETYILGAPEIICKNIFKQIESEVEKYNSDSRVIMLAKSKNQFIGHDLPNNIEPIALIVIKDIIRPSSKKTIAYFKKQGVNIKIISGDNPKTVNEIAKQVGLNKNNYIDATLLKDFDSIKKAVAKYDIFGRVTPTQKKDIIIALKQLGNVVAMTGDGVNDVLALKESDFSIALSSGSDAARNVSQLVLLDSNFESLPIVLREGRKCINNIQRSATLFLCKTIYATTLAILFLFIDLKYPFIPIQLTLTSVVTIGIPSFILALEPNNDKIMGRFLVNILSKAFPAAITIVLNIIIIMSLMPILNITSSQASTLSVIITGFTGFMLLYKISIPLNRVRTILLILMITLFITSIVGLSPLFSLALITPNLLLLVLILMMISVTFFNTIGYVFDQIVKKYPKVFY